MRRATLSLSSRLPKQRRAFSVDAKGKFSLFVGEKKRHEERFFSLLFSNVNVDSFSSQNLESRTLDAFKINQTDGRGPSIPKLDVGPLPGGAYSATESASGAGQRTQQGQQQGQQGQQKQQRQQMPPKQSATAMTLGSLALAGAVLWWWVRAKERECEVASGGKRVSGRGGKLKKNEKVIVLFFLSFSLFLI